jgi:hypothetical protein
MGGYLKEQCDECKRTEVRDAVTLAAAKTVDTAQGGRISLIHQNWDGTAMPTFVAKQFAAGLGWLDPKEFPPVAGMLIVKRWKNGAVWAGRYTGSEKDGSFHRYYLLPEEVEDAPV